ncbi:MAG: 2-C-methyl-D-erythritol 2,4-cyclodiphosphate synthase [Planctomycetales bacterium]
MTTLRVGIGHDTHRLEPGNLLRLGGVEVPHDRQAVGHSDADVLLHAVIDAMLGAAALGDIGQLFPDTDQENRDRDSAGMLQEAYRRVRSAGFEVVNLDCIVFAERPKIAPHACSIRQRIADLLELAVENIGLKAKTGEAVGPIGNEQAISAQCVVLLEKRS